LLGINERIYQRIFSFLLLLQRRTIVDILTDLEWKIIA